MFLRHKRTCRKLVGFFLLNRCDLTVILQEEGIFPMEKKVACFVEEGEPEVVVGKIAKA